MNKVLEIRHAIATEQRLTGIAFGQFSEMVDSALAASFVRLGVSVVEVQLSKDRFRCVEMEGTRKWFWDGEEILRVEPLLPPSYGFKLLRPRK